jgi:hypothetical protein
MTAMQKPIHDCSHIQVLSDRLYAIGSIVQRRLPEPSPDIIVSWRPCMAHLNGFDLRDLVRLTGNVLVHAMPRSFSASRPRFKTHEPKCDVMLRVVTEPHLSDASNLAVHNLVRYTARVR